jgi:hypothetical protein
MLLTNDSALAVLIVLGAAFVLLAGHTLLSLFRTPAR